MILPKENFNTDKQLRNVFSEKKRKNTKQKHNKI